MKDCAFWVADTNMAATVKGFLGRPQFHRSLGCAPFVFEVFVDAHRDPGVFSRADTSIADFRNSYRHAVVMLDCAWDGSPGQAAIKQQLTVRIAAAGWDSTRFLVVAIDPELEAWIWQDNIHVEEALRHSRPPKLRDQLLTSGHWPGGTPKPVRPKEVLEALLRQKRIPRSSSLYQAIAARVSVGGCIDTEFLALRARLQAWFPA
jgi:hypothetical protein